MDKDEAIHILLGWFGHKPFSISEMTDARVHEIARLVGADTLTSHGRRSQLGKQLTAMVDYRCSTTPNLGATLTAERNPVDVDPGPEVYRIQHL